MQKSKLNNKLFLADLSLSKKANGKTNGFAPK